MKKPPNIFGKNNSLTYILPEKFAHFKRNVYFCGQLMVISMCKVTEEIVLRANDRLAQNMERGMHRQAVAGEGIVVPVTVFGMTFCRSISVERINEIYDAARRAVIQGNGKGV